MKKWTTFVCTALLSLSLLVSAFGEEMETAAYVSFGGYDVLMDSASILADKVGQKDAIELWKMMAGDVEGIAKDKPAGVLLLTDGSDVFPFVFLPISDLTNPELPTLFAGGTYDDAAGTYTLGSQVCGIVMRDGWTFLFPEGGADNLPEGDPMDFIEAEDASQLLAARVYTDRISSDTIDQFVDWASQFANNTEDSEDEDLPDAQISGQTQVAAQVAETISLIVKNAKTLSVGISVDSNNGDFVVSYSMIPLEGSELAEIFPNMKNRQTNWKEVFKPQTSVLALMNNTVVLPSQVETQRASYKMVFEQLIDSIIDSDDAEEGEKILSQVEDFVDQTIALGKTDYAFQITNDNLVEFAGTVAGGQNLVEMFDAIEKTLAENEEDVAEILQSRKINGKEYKGFTVSTITFAQELTDSLAEDFPDLAGAELSILFAVKDDAIIAIAGLDQGQIVQRFKKIAESSRTEAVDPLCLQFSLKNLGAYLGALLPNAEGKLATAISLLNDMDEGAVICARQDVEGDTFSGSFVVTGNFLESLGATFTTLTQDDEEESDEE